jgi:hypothetical protein
MVQMFDSFLSFFLEPAVHFTAERHVAGDANAVELDWLLSFTYPLPWRPRVTFSGSTRAAFSSLRPSPNRRLITSVVEDWDAPVRTIFKQTLPRLSDILWLYPAPHAETDDSTRKLLSKHDGYSIVRLAARPELRIRASIWDSDKPYVRATPALPAALFDGRLRRKEDYSTVSPISVRCVDGDNEYEWAVPIPGTMIGSGTGLPEPSSQADEAQFVDTPARRCAIVRYRGYALSEKFEKKCDELVSKLQRDGFLPEGQDVEGSRVWARSYDCKIGFNSLSLLCIATYGTTRGVPPRLNELLIELPSDE